MMRAMAWRWTSLSLDGWPGEETVRAALVEVQYPVPDDLKPDAGDFRRLGARRTVIDRRQRKKPTGLRAIFPLLCQTPQL